MRPEPLTFGGSPRLQGGAPAVPLLARDLRIGNIIRPPVSVRIPVTPGNRALLRKLRAAELAAWEGRFSYRPAYAGKPQEPSL